MLLEYIELNPVVSVFVKLVATSKREPEIIESPESAKMLHVVVPVKVGFSVFAFKAKFVLVSCWFRFWRKRLFWCKRLLLLR